MEIRPSWLPFTPWTTADDLADILEFISQHDLDVDPVQVTIRLLIPEGSLVLDVPERDPSLSGFLRPRAPHLALALRGPGSRSAAGAAGRPGRGGSRTRRAGELAHAGCDGYWLCEGLRSPWTTFASRRRSQVPAKGQVNNPKSSERFGRTIARPSIEACNFRGASVRGIGLDRLRIQRLANQRAVSTGSMASRWRTSSASVAPSLNFVATNTAASSRSPRTSTPIR